MVLGLVFIGACASEGTDPLCDAGVAVAGGPTVANVKALVDVAEGLDEPDRTLLIDAARSVSDDLTAFETGAIDSYDTGELASIVAELCPDREFFASVVSR